MRNENIYNYGIGDWESDPELDGVAEDCILDPCLFL